MKTLLPYSTKFIKLIAFGLGGIVFASPASAAKKSEKPIVKPSKKSQPTKSSPPATQSRFTLQGVIDTRLIVTDSAKNNLALPVTGLKTRYTGTGDPTGTGAPGLPNGKSRTLFRISQLSLQPSYQIFKQWSAHARLNIDLESPDTNRLGGRMGQFFQDGHSLGIIYGFVQGKAVIGKTGSVKIGAFALPFFHESQGPIGTGKLSISSGAASTAVKGSRAQGVEFSFDKIKPNAKYTGILGVFSNLDSFGVGSVTVGGVTGATNYFRLQDIQGDIGAFPASGRNYDGELGFYLDAKAEAPRGNWQIDAGYLDNGTDKTAARSVRTRFWILGGRRSIGKISFQGHFINGTSKNAVPRSAQWSAYSLLVSVPVQKLKVTLRHDSFKNQVKELIGKEEDGSAWSFAVQYPLNTNQKLTLEWLSPENSPTTSKGPTADANDNQTQLSWQYFF